MQWLILISVLPYFLLLMWIYKHLKRIKPFNPSGVSLTGVTVIIPCRNESDNLKRILPDILAQNYPAQYFQVIIVDDNSADDTFKVAAGFSDFKNLTVLRNKGKGKKAALATGLDAASGDIIITTDADCRMERRWISTITAFYNMYKPDLIICPVMLEPGNGFFGKFQELEFLSLQGVTAGSAAGGRSSMCNGANLVCSKESYISHSGNLHFEIPSGDDVFLLHSIKNEKGSKIEWLESREALVTASRAKTLRSFLNQRKRWLSKERAYTDRFTILLGIATFVTIAAWLTLIVAAFFNLLFLWIFLAFFILKTVPDFLILHNTTTRYGKKELMKWFLPSQLIYPFYVIAVILNSGGPVRNDQINFPFQRGT